MLNYDENGFLTPYDVIPADLKLLENEFVVKFANESRQRLFDKMAKYLIELKTLIGEDLVVWVNGSFVTQKLNPNDIDVVVFVSWRKAEQFSKELKNFSYPLALGNYGVDGYLVRVYEPGHPKHVLTHSDRLHWLHDFGRTQPARNAKAAKKGFLEIKF